MQDPDRLNTGESLPIKGTTATPRPPIKMHDFSLPGPSATPDASQRFIEKLLESIPVPPTIAPTQTTPAQPAQVQPPQPAPVPPAGSQGGFLDWAKRELNPLDAASWKEAGNISKDMLIDTAQYVQQSLAKAPLPFAPSFTGGDLGTGVLEGLMTQEATAMAQASQLGQNLMEFATGTSAIGEALGIPQPDSSRMAESKYVYY